MGTVVLSLLRGIGGRTGHLLLGKNESNHHRWPLSAELPQDFLGGYQTRRPKGISCRLSTCDCVDHSAECWVLSTHPHNKTSDVLLVIPVQAYWRQFEKFSCVIDYLRKRKASRASFPHASGGNPGCYAP
jgi:hypothetical protein